MRIYTKETIRTLYKDHALSVANKIKDNLLDFAERNPDACIYEESVYISEKTADLVLAHLMERFPDSIVQMEFVRDDPEPLSNSRGMAKFHINWD